MSSVQSVDRAFRLLEAIGDRPSALTELARRVELPVSTTSRLLGTLEQLGAVERVDDLGIFRIGPSILTMASSVDASASLKAVARPELERLAEAVGEDTGLSVAAGHTMHYIDQVDSNQAVQVRNWVDARLPMHLVASGIVTLASWGEDAVRAYLDRDLEGATDRSVVDPERLRARLAEAAERGIAWTNEELEVGINAVAAPLIAGSGEVVGAIHVHGPSYRFPSGAAARIESVVLESAGRLSAALGIGAIDPAALVDAPAPGAVGV